MKQLYNCLFFIIIMFLVVHCEEKPELPKPDPITVVPPKKDTTVVSKPDTVVVTKPDTSVTIVKPNWILIKLPDNKEIESETKVKETDYHQLYLQIKNLDKPHEPIDYTQVKIQLEGGADLGRIEAEPGLITSSQRVMNIRFYIKDLKTPFVDFKYRVLYKNVDIGLRELQVEQMWVGYRVHVLKGGIHSPETGWKDTGGSLEDDRRTMFRPTEYFKTYWKTTETIALEYKGEYVNVNGWGYIITGFLGFQYYGDVSMEGDEDDPVFPNYVFSVSDHTNGNRTVKIPVHLVVDRELREVRRMGVMITRGNAESGSKANITMLEDGTYTYVSWSYTGSSTSNLTKQTGKWKYFTNIPLAAGVSECKTYTPAGALLKTSYDYWQGLGSVEFDQHILPYQSGFVRGTNTLSFWRHDFGAPAVYWGGIPPCETQIKIGLGKHIVPQ